MKKISWVHIFLVLSLVVAFYFFVSASQYLSGKLTGNPEQRLIIVAALFLFLNTVFLYLWSKGMQRRVDEFKLDHLLYDEDWGYKKEMTLRNELIYLGIFVPFTVGWVIACYVFLLWHKYGDSSALLALSASAGINWFSSVYAYSLYGIVDTLKKPGEDKANPDT